MECRLADGHGDEGTTGVIDLLARWGVSCGSPRDREIHRTRPRGLLALLSSGSERRFVVGFGVGEDGRERFEVTVQPAGARQDLPGEGIEGEIVHRG